MDVQFYTRSHQCYCCAAHDSRVCSVSWPKRTETTAVLYVISPLPPLPPHVKLLLPAKQARSKVYATAQRTLPKEKKINNTKGQESGKASAMKEATMRREKRKGCQQPPQAASAQRAAYNSKPRPPPTLRPISSKRPLPVAPSSTRRAIQPIMAARLFMRSA